VRIFFLHEVNEFQLLLEGGGAVVEVLLEFTSGSYQSVNNRLFYTKPKSIYQFSQ
jgi:hypothetical protein